MVVTEALAHGIPVLATRVGGLPEAARPRAPGGRRPGILVPPDDPAALAGAVEQWLGDPAAARAPAPAAAERPPAPLPTWAATSAEVVRRAGRTTGWRPDRGGGRDRLGRAAGGGGEPASPGAVCPEQQVLRSRPVGRSRRPGGRNRRERGGGGRVRWAARSSSAALVVVLGTGPFLAALRATDARALAVGALIAAAHHAVRGLAVAARRAPTGHRPHLRRRRGLVLPRPVPQRHAARRGARRRRARGAARTGRR